MTQAELLKNALVIDRGRFGWAIEWGNGFLSAMPNEATARICLTAALTAGYAATPLPESPIEEMASTDTEGAG
jgi:hypothetical protein